MSRLPVRAHTANANLTPDQKRFKSLTNQVDKVRRDLQDWIEQVPPFRGRYDSVIDTLRESFIAKSLQWIRGLDEMLQRRDWSQRERRALAAVLREDAQLLLAIHEDEALKALYDKYSPVKFDVAKQRELKMLHEMTEAFTGVDLGDASDIRSEEDLAERLYEQMQAREARDQEARERRAQKRPKTEAQKRREADAQQTHQSLREIYRKLVSALHPDREPDEQLRAQKTELMQKVNRAYDAKDLLTLLDVQLQVETGLSKQLTAPSAVQLKHYNKLLAQQLAELKSQLDAVRREFYSEFMVEDIWLKPLQLDKLTGIRAKQLREDVSDVQERLELLTQRAALQDWLKREMRQQRRAPRFDDDLPG